MTITPERLAARLKSLLSPSVFLSLTGAILAFGLDRAHKTAQIAADCIAPGLSVCVQLFSGFAPVSMSDWRGGEIVHVTGFFDYLLTWNTGISYGLLDGLPIWALGLIMIAAIAALAFWWVKADSGLIRVGLAVCIGGALSNALDRYLYGAVADFFYFHVGDNGFYIFNLADVAISFGVTLLILDLLGVGRKRAERQ